MGQFNGFKFEMERASLPPSPKETNSVYGEVQSAIHGFRRLLVVLPVPSIVDYGCEVGTWLYTPK